VVEVTLVNGFENDGTATWEVFGVAGVCPSSSYVLVRTFSGFSSEDLAFSAVTPCRQRVAESRARLVGAG